MTKHKWKAFSCYVGTYDDHNQGRSYSTELHDVKCAECQKVVTGIPEETFPDLEGCPGRRPLNDGKPRATAAQFQHNIL